MKARELPLAERYLDPLRILDVHNFLGRTFYHQKMSLEERTLVVRNIDGDRITESLLEELFGNFGPVVRVVLRKNFAFIEFTVKVSVGYAW